MLSLLNSFKLIFLNSPWARFRPWLLLLINLNQLICFEQSLFLALSWQNQKSFTFLNSIHPFTLITCSVKPIHFSKPCSNIFFIVSLIDITTCPAKDSITMFLILQIFTLIFITISHPFFPHPMSFSQSIFEQSFIIASIRPIVFPITIWLSSGILPFIKITIRELLSTLSMFQAVFETSLVSITVYPYMQSVTLCFTKSPLPYVTVSFYTFPHSRTMFQTVNPFTFVKFTVCPSVLSYSFRFAVNILAVIVATIGKFFIPHSLLIVSLPISFIDPIVVIDHNTLTVAFPINNLTIISSFSIFLQLQIR